MNNLEKAREWAKNLAACPSTDRAHAAAEIIQSLPDQWADVEKVREIADDMSNWSIPGMLDTTDSVRLSQMMDGFIDRLNALLTPKLPTLADMTQAEREACVGMQADYLPLWEPVERVAIVGITDFGAMLMSQNWARSHREAGSITPLPDLPKLQWPAQEPRNPETPPAETLNNTSSDTPRNPRPEECCGKCPETIDGGWDCTCEDNPRCSKNTPNPEDVPPNEPWLIEVDGEKAIGTRYRGDAHEPWAVAALTGSFAGDYGDNAVTLIHKLVPETHTLPEGMRLADHEEYGRVVVSPEDDLDGDYLAFYSDKNLEYGVSWAYPKEYELTFLDGGN